MLHLVTSCGYMDSAVLLNRPLDLCIRAADLVPCLLHTPIKTALHRIGNFISDWLGSLQALALPLSVTAKRTQQYYKSLQQLKTLFHF